MELPLVVGVDGSSSSFHALDWAVDEAAKHEAPLRIVHARAWERYEELAPSFNVRGVAGQPSAEHITGFAVERARLRDPRVKVTSECTSQEAAMALLEEGRNACCLVVGSRGRGGFSELLLGSVSLAVAARADCPVVVVRGSETSRAGRFQRVVLGVAEEEVSLAVAFAFREAALRGVGLLAVRAWRCPSTERRGADAYPTVVDAYQRRVREELDAALAAPMKEHPEVEARLDAVEGHPHRVLLEASRTADLLVVGARRRVSHFGLQLGSVPHAALHHASCPVAVVPQL